MSTATPRDRESLVGGSWGLSLCFAVSLAGALWAPAAVGAAELRELAGEWVVRIDAGGEQYESRLTLRHDYGEERGAAALSGKYEAQGVKGRVRNARTEADYFVVEVETKRRGMPTLGIFSFELDGGRMVGDVDMETGADVRSYEFQADRVAASQPTGASAAVATIPSEAEAPNQVPSVTNDATVRGGVVTFQTGERGYAGAVDTEIWAIAPSKPLDRQGTMTADGNNGGGESQVLMRFDDLFGLGDGQAPMSCRIVSAKLTVVAFDPGSTVYVHRVLAPWNAAATWDGMAAGVSIDNIEASTVRDGFSFGEITMDKQSVEFDVTGTVQKWADGEPNLGWVFINTGDNGWDFYSSDWIEAGLRPSLEIEFETR